MVTITKVFGEPLKDMVDGKDYQIIFSTLPQILVLHESFAQGLNSIEAVSRAFNNMVRKDNY
jgi:hypothetical protein